MTENSDMLGDMMGGWFRLSRMEWRVLEGCVWCLLQLGRGLNSGSFEAFLTAVPRLLQRQVEASALHMQLAELLLSSEI